MRVTYMNGAFGLIAALTLTACAGTPSTGGFGGGSVASRWENRVVTISMAQRIADACHDQGIYLAASRYGGAVHRATEEMVAEGTDRAALEAAYQNQDFGALSTKIDSEIARRGGNEAQPASLCALGEKEIAAGSDLGQTLQKG